MKLFFTAFFISVSAYCIAQTSTFNYTGTVQTFIVPASVTSINVDARGAGGSVDGAGLGVPGKGGRLQATLNVIPSETLYVFIGGAGAVMTGGFNGGGNGGTANTGPSGGGGGGMSDLRQGFNSHWLLGNNPLKARLIFSDTSYVLQSEFRKMPFSDTQATIADSSGNFLMSSNGIWIANANNDTMMNGSGLNPSQFTNAYSDGLLLPYANIFLPFPGDPNKYILFHHTAKYDGYSYPTYEILSSTIDITLDGGLGAVTFKNDTVLKDTLEWGLAACRHANGRDWWIVSIKHSSDIIFKILLTPNGIDTVISQQLNVPYARYNVTQPTFSQDGNQFAYYRYDSVSLDETVILLDFDRCSGLFSNPDTIPVTTNTYLWGLSFSPSGKFLYVCSSLNIFQINTDSLTADTVAWFDGFAYPFPPFYTTFDNNYLAANGKIYIVSGNSTWYLHYINYPDSAGLSCDVKQHDLYLDSVSHFRGVPNHPNYYLDCDTTLGCPCLNTGIDEISQYDFHFSVSPNPNDGNFKIVYLLPQNKRGTFEVFDVNGRKVYSQHLPQWSTMQVIRLPEVADGIYNCIVSSDNTRAFRKVAVITE